MASMNVSYGLLLPTGVRTNAAVPGVQKLEISIALNKVEITFIPVPPGPPQVITLAYNAVTDLSLNKYP